MITVTWFKFVLAVFSIFTILSFFLKFDASTTERNLKIRNAIALITTVSFAVFSALSGNSVYILGTIGGSAVISYNLLSSTPYIKI